MRAISRLPSAHCPTGPHKGDGSRSPGLRQRGPLAALAAGILALTLGACESGPPPGTVGYVQGFAGLVATDEPRAAVVGRDVLSAGGTAHDAATAIGFALAVTLPSAAGLGGGGVCLIHDLDADEESRVAVLDFLPTTPAGLSGPAPASPGDAPVSLDGIVRPAWEPVAVPALVRGLFALHARGGVLRWESAVTPAETMARFGIPASRALAAEVAALGGPPPDPSMTAVFGPGPLAEGQAMQNRDLARALAVVRTKPGDLYGGLTGRELAEAAAGIGHDLTVSAMRDWRPATRAPVLRETGGDWAAFSPVPDSAARLAERWAAAGDGDGDGGDENGLPPPLPNLAATLGSRGATSFVVADRFGNAIACALTLNRPFGTGRMVPGFGFPLAPPPGPDSPALALMLRYNEPTADARAAVAAAGAGAVPLAVAAGVPVVEDEAPVPEALATLPAGGLGKGLVTLFACPDGVSDGPGTCQVGVDPRGAGLGLRVGLP
ncbi:gamma-glutamyltransferase [Roseospira visakhapatnamensis]|uniref:Gamma-glutamyltranspeptidase/glutathione hydrolase n=1 Tax=Roseospira visakhapatnamensis TaxID=390880 RepID=A0A7W6W847_9PROT|nr:gamma-glutamyltransferase [Roseospira visakhapatnamensis]MBB4264423.1 gamma-glutamyltranspeptidase/glutathione hydrolase [Roseospira visakhapatnamensis]